MICPDNGLITWAWRDVPRAGEGSGIGLASQISQFHVSWRGICDYGVPVAGMLAAGRELGRKNIDRLTDSLLLDLFPAKPGDKSGKIIRIDHFGNAITNYSQLSSCPIESDFRSVRVKSKQSGNDPADVC